MPASSQQLFARSVLHKLDLFKRPGFPTFQEFIEDWFPKHWMNLMAEKAGGTDRPDFVAMMELFYAVYIVDKAGGAVFEISPHLLCALRDTELPDAPSEDVRLPFEGINVDFPKGTLQPPSHEVSRFMLSLGPRDRFRVVYNHDERTNYISFIPTPGLKLHACLKEAEKNKWDLLLDPAAARLFKEKEMYDDYWKTDMFRLAVNTMLYITSPDADIVEDKSHVYDIHKKLDGRKGGRKRDVLLSKLSQAKSNKRYIVGAKFRLSQEYQADLTPSGKSWVLEHRVRVMGHWKMQPHGPGKTERKRIWIAPYFRGLSYAEMVERKYIVGIPTV